jgi:hypothetical protein
MAKSMNTAWYPCPMAVVDRYVDITDQLQVERALRESQHQLHPDLHLFSSAATTVGNFLTPTR